MGRSVQNIAPTEQADAEKALRERFHRGDSDAFSALVTPNLDTIYTLCLRVCGNPTEADDLAQETLLRAMTRHSRYDPGRPFRPWVLTIATNLCRDRLRTVWWRRVLPFAKPHYAEAPSPEHTTENAQKDAQVRAALSALPLRYREALSLFYLEDMSYQEMSVITGSSVPALKQRVRRGRGMLREIVSEMYPEMGTDT